MSLWPDWPELNLLLVSAIYVLEFSIFIEEVVPKPNSASEEEVVVGIRTAFPA